MTSSTRSDFHALARGHSVVPVWREVLADYTTPVAAFARLCGGEETGFLFESVERERWSRWSFVGRRPSATIVSRDGRLEVTGDLPSSVPRDQGVLAAIEAMLATHRSRSTDSSRNPGASPTSRRNSETGVARSARSSRHTGTTR
jgi:anthranilate synthase component 1